MMKSLLLSATALVVSIAPQAGAAERYREKPPIVISSADADPWVMQLAGNGVAPVVYVNRRVVSQPRIYSRSTVSVESLPGVESTLPRRVRAKGYLVDPRARVAPQAVALRAERPAATRLDPAYLPQMVAYDSQYKPGTIIIDTNNRFLYLVAGNGQARRYGVGVGKPGFEWAGTHKITRKAEWPQWNPPSEMIAREAKKGHYLPASMEGGPENPLGARAMYLGSTLYRIHGTNAPWTIGSAVSSGCIRMRNEDVVDLYERVKVGTKVIVL